PPSLHPLPLHIPHNPIGFQKDLTLQSQVLGKIVLTKTHLERTVYFAIRSVTHAASFYPKHSSKASSRGTFEVAFQILDPPRQRAEKLLYDTVLCLINP